MKTETEQKISNLIIWLAIGTLIGSIIWFWPWYLLGVNLLLITLAIYFIPDEYNDEEQLTHNQQLEHIFERDGALTSGRRDNITQLKDFLDSVIIPEGSLVKVEIYEEKLNNQYGTTNSELICEHRFDLLDIIIREIEKEITRAYEKDSLKKLWIRATIFHPKSVKSALK